MKRAGSPSGFHAGGRRALGVAARGYTMIEVLMALAILAVGASGVITLQKITVVGVTNGRNINVATGIAQAHLERVRVDATRWQGIIAGATPAGNTEDYADATLLTALLPTSSSVAGAWTLASAPFPDSTGLGLGVSDVTGDTDGAPGTNPVGYCTHVRLVPVMFDPNSERYNTGIPGGGPTLQARDALLIRVEVRTFWAKAGREVDAECTAANVPNVTAMLAGTAMTVNSVDYTAADYGWVFLASAIRPNEFRN